MRTPKQSPPNTAIGMLCLALATTPALAQGASDFYRPFKPASPDTSSGGGAGNGDTANDAACQAELVRKSLNPVASKISVPVQNNWDFGIGPDDAMKCTANIQPVIPVTLLFPK